MQPNKHLWQHLSQFCLEWEMFQTEVVEKIKTHILSENRAIHEIMWEKYCRAGQATGDNTVERDRPQVTIWGMRITCWITKATNTHSEYVNTYCFPGCTNAPQCYVTLTLPVLLLQYSAWYANKHYDGSLVNRNLIPRHKPIYFINRTNIYQ